MRALTSISVAWTLAAVLGGVFGSSWLHSGWRAREEADFVGDLQAALLIVRDAQWQEPWQADPDWLAMERALALQIVPTRTAADSSLTASQLAPLWSRSPAGRYWITAGARMDFANSSDSVFLRISRELDGDPLWGLWWTTWIATSFLGVLFAAAALAERRRTLRLLNGLLAPWLTAIRYQAPTANYLPEIESDSVLEPALRIVSESVNRTIFTLLNVHERSELVLGNLQEGVLAIDSRTRVLLTNHALRSLLDLQGESCLDRPLGEIVRMPKVYEVAEKVLNDRRPHEEIAVLENPQRSLRVLGRPLPLQNQAPGALITVRDETLIRRIESLRRDFVANASHEFKTPLAAIRAYAETLQMGALDDRPAAEQFVGAIIEQADRINGLVQGMLQLSRVESVTALEIERFDATQAIEPCIAAARAMAHAKRIEIESVLPAQPLEIRCDRGGFQTIASNLLSNAVRYTHDGGSVSVTLGEDSGWVFLRVVDTGIGIHPRDLERIFERFYRADKNRSAETGGTGLGLSIVKHLAQALGGHVSATSQPGKGSCFEVRLPASGA